MPRTRRLPATPADVGRKPTLARRDLGAAVVSTAQSADRAGLNVQLGGAAIENVATSGGDYTSVLLGIVAALVVLFFAFRRSCRLSRRSS